MSSIGEILGAYCRVEHAAVGLAVTRYTVRVDFGATTYQKFRSRAPTIAARLGVSGVVIAPAGEPDLVWIDVPRKDRVSPRLGDIAIPQGDRYTVALGVSPGGGAVKVHIPTAPHLLVAGTTGSGKSVCLNSILCGLLQRNTPETMRLVLIDPKRTELSPYKGLPHLDGYAVDPDDAVGVLEQAVELMESAYSKIERAGCRDLSDWCAVSHRRECRTVIVVDEMADLFGCRTYGKHARSLITRLAQKARASGVHLVLATQTPRADIVTGVLKANLPTRLCFRVNTLVDSRVVLDDRGGECLQGQGDGIARLADGSIERFQGIYLSTDEVRGIVASASRGWGSVPPTLDYHEAECQTWAGWVKKFLT